MSRSTSSKGYEIVFLTSPDVTPILCLKLL